MARPLYHRSVEGGGVYQRFVEEHGEVLDYTVSGKELQAKQAMLACYKSQFDALPSFDMERERFRPQATYAYAERPHAGKLNYELWQWRMTAEEVSASFAAFRPTIVVSKR